MTWDIPLSNIMEVYASQVPSKSFHISLPFVAADGDELSFSTDGMPDAAS